MPETYAPHFGVALVVLTLVLFCWWREILRREHLEAVLARHKEHTIERVKRWRDRAIEAETKLIAIRNPPRGQGGRFQKRA